MAQDLHADARRLVALREAMGLSQRELAEAFGVASGAISQWESGKRRLPRPVLKLVEIYEQEVFPPPEPASPPSGASLQSWLHRGASFAPALLFLSIIYGADALDAAPPARVIRRAAMRQLLKTLGRLKGFSMKLGQLTGPLDLAIPAEERGQLARLQQDAAPMSTLEVCEVVLQELGELPTQLFATWTKDPIASASIGQVHRARDRDGRELAVKVQYPRIVDLLTADLRSIDVLDGILTKLVPSQQPGEIHEELRARFLEECDYELEARNLADFAHLFRLRDDMKFATVVPERSTGRVLTTTWLAGVSLDEFVARASPAERARAAYAIWDFYFESYLRHGRFNADPHPANLLFMENAVGFVDFGRIKRFSAPMLELWRAMARSMLERDMPSFRQRVIELGSAPDPSRYDFHYGFQVLACFFRPCLVDGSFLVDERMLRRMWELTRHNVNHRQTNYPKAMVFLDQLHFGVVSILARLAVPLELRPRLLRILYEPGETPLPYSPSELDALDLGL